MKIVKHAGIEKAVEVQMERGLRTQLKELCTRYENVPKTSTVLKGVELAASLTPPCEPPVLAVVEVHQGLMFFSLSDKSERQWLTEIDSVDKRVAPTPRSVLVKMVALRVKKVFEAAEEWNKSEHIRSMGHPRVSFPDMTSAAAFAEIRKLVSDVGSTGGAYWAKKTFEKVLKEAALAMEKPGVDDQVILEGWALQSTREVMES